MNCGCNILIFGNQVPQMEYMAIKTYLNKMDRKFRKSGQSIHHENLFDTAKRGQALVLPEGDILLPVKMGSGKRNNTGYLSLAHVRSLYTDGDGYATAVLQYDEYRDHTLSIHLLCKAESVMDRINRAFRRFPNLDNQSISLSALSIDKLVDEYMKRKRGPHLMQNEGWNQFIKDCASHYRYKTKEEVQALISSWRDMLKNAQNDDEIEEKELFLDRLEMACIGLHVVFVADTTYETVKGNGTEASPEVQVPKKVRLPQKRINTGWDEKLSFPAFASIHLDAFVKAVNVSPVMESIQRISEGLRNMGVLSSLSRMARDMGTIFQQESVLQNLGSTEMQGILRNAMGKPLISTELAESLKHAMEPPFMAAEISQTMRMAEEAAGNIPRISGLLMKNPADYQRITRPLGTLDPSCFFNAGLIHQATYTSKLASCSYWSRQMGIADDDSDE
ncbi:hypothetical protein [Dialister succinatiphilus]|uniref:hypothetical protein n=1 Tax=Dialister succinatiphilus TaxID=487173 RepID=UPI003F7FDE1C